MARASGQIIKRGERKYLIRIFLGQDSLTGKRKYLNKTINGTKTEAKIALVALLRERDLGTLVEHNKTSLNNYLDNWLNTSAEIKVREATFNDYVWLLTKYIRPHLGKKQLVKITPLDIQAIYSQMLARGLSARTVRYAHSVLHNALNQAVKWRLLTTNPADFVDLPKHTQIKKIYVMTQEEANRFLVVAQNGKWYLLFAVLLSTGLRPSEALGLKWEDIDQNQKVLRIQRKLTRLPKGYKLESNKTQRSKRVVDYPESLDTLFDVHREQQMLLGNHNENLNLVFVGEAGNPAHEQNILKRHFRPELKKADINPKMRLYDLRHTHATLLLLAGVHPKTVSERLGHSSVKITLDTYSHMLPTIQKQASDAVENMLFKPTQKGENTSLN